MEKKVTVITERIDDIVLLLNVMMQMGLPNLLNQHLHRHWKQQGLDWGWVATIWLSYILSEGDHRKVMVRKWVDQRRYMLEQVCGIEISDTDFTDDRLAIVLRQLLTQQCKSQKGIQKFQGFQPKKCQINYCRFNMCRTPLLSRR